jgi:transmembrane sensor
VNIDAAMAWRQGRLVFDNVPLRDVVTELGRYRRGRIVVASPSLASRAVSGVFDTADLESALDTICRELGVKMISAGSMVTFLY